MAQHTAEATGGASDGRDRPWELGITRPALVPDPQEEIARRLHLAIHGLNERAPMLSAQRTFLPRQRLGLIGGAAALVALAVLWPWITLPTVVGLTIVVYLSTIAFRISLLYHAVRHPAIETVTDSEARAVPDAALPVYTLLIPCYREAEILEQILGGLEQIEYPRDKLDIKLLLEEDDVDTVAAAHALGADRLCDVVVVPAAEPRTKPKALNYGLQAARGRYVTIFDAEDRPDPAAAPQGRHRPRPGPGRRRLPAGRAGLLQRGPEPHHPLVHARVRALVPPVPARPGAGPTPPSRSAAPPTTSYARCSCGRGPGTPSTSPRTPTSASGCTGSGYRTGMLDSTTYEEANSDFVNWVKQRSRWYKGYLQTWLVHMRQPIQLRPRRGLRGFLGFNLFVGGTPVLALLNPVFWLLTILWFLLKPAFILRLLPAPIYYTSLLAWLLGNFFFAYTFVVAAYRHPEPRVFTAALLAPLYWVAMSLAAAKAFSSSCSPPVLGEDPARPGPGRRRPVAGGGGRRNPWNPLTRVSPSVRSWLVVAASPGSTWCRHGHASHDAGAGGTAAAPYFSHLAELRRLLGACP